MDFYSFDNSKLPASVSISHFKVQDAAEEFHVIVRPKEYDSFDKQLDSVFRAYRDALNSIGQDVQTAVLRRFFCSDLVNQSSILEANALSNPHNPNGQCAVSWICQSPGLPAKVLLWAYHISDPKSPAGKLKEGTTLTFKRGELTHHWTAGITCIDSDAAYKQTRSIFEKYQAFLKTRAMTLADNVIRTWLFVRDIDANYHAMAQARRDFFAERRLTAETHFIASTGVEGTFTNPAAKVVLDAYAVEGIRPEQIKFLRALDHLSPTYIYGVTFERGTAVAYRDRSHIFISGTASIDHKGKILYPGQLSKQLDRTIENMEALLKETGASLNDMCSFLVYVRDPADYPLAAQHLRQHFPKIPIGIVVAPVCRPGWLIEIEGIAVIPQSNPQLPSF